MDDDFLQETVLRVESVSKLYARRPGAMRKRVAKTARSAIFGGRPPSLGDLEEHEFWALKGVSFELKRGEALGIIGLNGSGKTTLLRLLAGQLLPDKGEIWINGSTAAMIDLTAGFQAGASGRENIFLRAAALGFTNRQTLEHLDEIIEFSELGDAIDAPMRSYSSGMQMRLAFSVMAIVKPEILLIDEVLAVGDFRFKQKCLSKIRLMRDESAFVFVSHSMGDIRRFCDRVMVLHQGRIHFTGPASEAIEIYESLDGGAPDAGSTAQINSAMGPKFENKGAITSVKHHWINEQGEIIEAVNFDERITLAISFNTQIDIRKLFIGIPVWNVNAHYTTGLSTQMHSGNIAVNAGESVEITLTIDGRVINPGTMKSMLGIVDGAEFLYRQPNPDLIIRGAPHPTWGAVTIPHRWKIKNQSADGAIELAAP